MTRQKIIENLKAIAEEVAWDSDGELTDYARERAYVCIQQAIRVIRINYGE